MAVEKKSFFIMVLKEKLRKIRSGVKKSFSFRLRWRLILMLKRSRSEMARKAPKVTIVWNKNLTLSYFASNKPIMLQVKMYGDKFEDAIKPCLSGWFKSEDPKDWNYRVIYL